MMQQGPRGAEHYCCLPRAAPPQVPAPFYAPPPIHMNRPLLLLLLDYPSPSHAPLVSCGRRALCPDTGPPSLPTDFCCCWWWSVPDATPPMVSQP